MQRLGAEPGAPALMLHAALAAGRDWAPLVAALPVTLDALAPDLPGHGRSGAWDGQGDYHGVCTGIARDLLVQHAARGPAVLFGHSFGATVALRTALLRPELVRALVLFEPVLFAAARGTDIHAAHLRAEAPMVAALRAGDLFAAAELFLAQWGDDGRPWQALAPEKRARLAARMPLIAAGAPGLHDDTGGVLMPGRIDALACPVLLVTGGKSPPVVECIAQTLAARLPDCTRARVASAGHMVPLTHARESACIAGRWWHARLDPAAVPGEAGVVRSPAPQSRTPAETGAPDGERGLGS